MPSQVSAIADPRKLNWQVGASYRLVRGSQRLLEEVDEVRRAQLTEGDKRLGTGIDRLVRDLLGDPRKSNLISLCCLYFIA